MNQKHATITVNQVFGKKAIRGPDSGVEGARGIKSSRGKRGSS